MFFPTINNSGDNKQSFFKRVFVLLVLSLLVCGTVNIFAAEVPDDEPEESEAESVSSEQVQAPLLSGDSGEGDGGEDPVHGAGIKNVTVGSGGAMNYSYAIKLPPGTKGVQPEISLVYNSSGGNGTIRLSSTNVLSFFPISLISNEGKYCLCFNPS